MTTKQEQIPTIQYRIEDAPNLEQVEELRINKQGNMERYHEGYWQECDTDE